MTFPEKMLDIELANDRSQMSLEDVQNKALHSDVLFTAAASLLTSTALELVNERLDRVIQIGGIG